jgi:hypothetical protein
VLGIWWLSLVKTNNQVPISYSLADERFSFTCSISRKNDGSFPVIFSIVLPINRSFLSIEFTALASGCHILPPTNVFPCFTWTRGAVINQLNGISNLFHNNSRRWKAWQILWSIRLIWHGRALIVTSTLPRTMETKMVDFPFPPILGQLKIPFLFLNVQFTLGWN